MFGFHVDFEGYPTKACSERTIPLGFEELVVGNIQGLQQFESIKALLCKRHIHTTTIHHSTAFETRPFFEAAFGGFCRGPRWTKVLDLK